MNVSMHFFCDSYIFFRGKEHVQLIFYENYSNNTYQIILIYEKYNRNF